MINLNLYVNYSEKSTKIVSRSPSPMHSILNNDSSNCLSSNSNSQMSSKSSKLPSLLTSHSSSSTSNYQTTLPTVSGKELEEDFPYDLQE